MGRSPHGHRSRAGLRTSDHVYAGDMDSRFREYQDAISSTASSPAEQSLAQLMREDGIADFEVWTSRAVLEEDERVVAAAVGQVATEDPPVLLVTDRRVLWTAQGLIRWKVRREISRSQIRAVEITAGGLMAPPRVRFAPVREKDLVFKLRAGADEVARLRERMRRSFGPVYRES